MRHSPFLNIGLPCTVGLWLFLVALGTLSGSVGSIRLLVCYVNNRDMERSLFIPEDIDASLCTHIVYAHATVNAQGTGVAPGKYFDERTKWYQGMYARMVALKKKNPSLKVLLSIGGPKMGVKPFSKLGCCVKERRKFISATIAFLKKHHFDGVALDWRYPAAFGGPPWDRAGIYHLMKDMATSFYNDFSKHRYNNLLMLTGIFPTDPRIIDRGYWLRITVNFMHFIMLQTYDFDNHDFKRTALMSPIFPNPRQRGYKGDSVAWAAHHYVLKGIPKMKIVIGIPLYARSFELVNKDHFNVGDLASGPGDPGFLTQEKGLLAYSEVCRILARPGARMYNMRSPEGAFIVKGKLWLSIEHKLTIQQKVCFAKKNKFEGVMLFSLDLDDFNGVSCGEGNFPLLRAAASEMKARDFNRCPKRPRMNAMSVRSAPGFRRPRRNVASVCPSSRKGLAPHPANDTLFYHCHKGHATQRSCPRDFVFVSDDSTCSFQPKLVGSHRQ